MYKVFIDHSPILFISKSDYTASLPSVDFVSVNNLNTRLRPALIGATYDRPLQIVCENPRVAFKEYFKFYKKIKAAGGLVKRKEKYLIIKRNGLWDIPKGKIDKGEDRADACVREIAEECGITGHQIIAPLTITRHVMKYKGQDAIKKTYWYLLSYDGPKETTPQILEGISKAKWVTLDELMAIRGKTYGSINHVLDSVEKELKSH